MTVDENKSKDDAPMSLPAMLKNYRSPLLRFVIKVFIWLPLMFALWYLTTPILAAPVKWLTQWLTQAAFGDLVQQVTFAPPVLEFVTSLRSGELSAGAVTSGFISVEVNALLYSFGLPMYAALILAAGGKGMWRRLLVGYLVMLPFIVWGVTADFLKNITFSAGAFVASQAGFSSLQREFIAFAYQFGALILPTVIPAMTWVLTHRRFLECLRGEMNAIDGVKKS
ncbi:MAG: hypothetical protein LBS40_03600 [Burkholderiales bacterium]|jgi:hypothetical protein|nr:hypothetical protein [Burkholderiales bacterium]